MASFTQDYLPGQYGTDYRFVVRGGKTYVVYKTPIKRNRQISMSWRIKNKDLEHYGATGGRVTKISREAFHKIQFFGEAGDITATSGKDTHPFQTYIRELRSQNPSASWLGDQEFMGTMLEGFAEGWDAARLSGALKTTKWYQSRTDRERDWEVMSKAQQKAEIGAFESRMAEAAQDILGPGFTLADAGIDSEKFKNQARKVVGGAWGDPEYGFLLWQTNLQNAAEKMEGTLAWVSAQQELQAKNEFLNQPENMKEQLRLDAMEWLGPQGVPDDATLTSWANRIVIGTDSEADWQTYVQQQARALYPWLGSNERWQDRASSYKNIAEKLTGKPMGWESPLLAKLGATDQAGVPSGAALAYDDYERVVRSTDDFWTGGVARDETFSLLEQVDGMFRGVR